MTVRFTREGSMTARTCEGCGKPKGCTPIALHGYWHVRCWQKATAAQRREVAIKMLQNFGESDMAYAERTR
jgi:hypothetical protein